MAFGRLSGWLASRRPAWCWIFVLTFSSCINFVDISLSLSFFKPFVLKTELNEIDKLDVATFHVTLWVSNWALIFWIRAFCEPLALFSNIPWTSSLGPAGKIALWRVVFSRSCSSRSSVARNYSKLLEAARRRAFSRSFVHHLFAGNCSSSFLRILSRLQNASFFPFGFGAATRNDIAKPTDRPIGWERKTHRA